MLFKSSLQIVGATCLFCLGLSFNVNAGDWNTGRTLGDWQGQGQGIGELNQGMNQDQKCCPKQEHRKHCKYHCEQDMGGTVHHEHQKIVCKNVIKTTTKEDVTNCTEGCIDTEDREKKIEKKCCPPCDK